MSRKPSLEAHRKVLRAALERIAERGIEGTSIDAIAERAGVSKATIYKHWKDKDALVLEMMADLSGLTARPTFDSGNTRSDMIDVLAYRPPGNAEARERIVPHLVAYGALRREFGDAWRNMAMEPARRELTHLLREGIRRGELDPALDLDLSLILLLGPMLYAHIFMRNSLVDPRPLAETVVDAFWRAYGHQGAAAELAVESSLHSG